MIAKIKTLILCIGFLAVADVFAADAIIPYSFDDQVGNEAIAFEYQVVMPSTSLTSFNTVVRYSGGHHRVEILGVSLTDGESTYYAVATGTEGTEVFEEGASYSGGNNYNNASRPKVNELSESKLSVCR